ncbi:rhodanese-like domain-containing protein [Sphingosinicella microcystinivorans]|uniref:rhodanese-like domain-containing protein n=1 Tax=Sphingosinicella microcystinivorans TaxID=335406 RepID=UPI0022F385F1|nr:rhodanese-like domain-containing protein [Sphingosinicella microcystinivorans]WBX85818.1 rhodanese-like domain-containing protein [Sphingosinicella microcystinivorans]
MFGSGGKAHKEIAPAALHAMLGHGSALVVDVREADAFAAGHIEGAVNLPLSRFSPADVPDADGRAIVLQCAAAKAAIDTHLAGGLAAWAAGCPVVR